MLHLPNLICDTFLNEEVYVYIYILIYIYIYTYIYKYTHIYISIYILISILILILIYIYICSHKAIYWMYWQWRKSQVSSHLWRKLMLFVAANISLPQCFCITVMIKNSCPYFILLLIVLSIPLDVIVWLTLFWIFIYSL